MAHSSTVDQKVENPGSLRASSLMTGIFGVFILIGVVSFFMAFGSDKVLAWTAYLRAHFFFMAVSILALFFVAITWITTSMWSAPVRRLAEGFTAYIPFALLSTAILFFGTNTLYSWTHADHVAGDPILSGKQGYLNITFFAIRTFIGLGLWLFFRNKLVGASLKTDTGGDYKTAYSSNRKWGIGFLVVFALSFTSMAIDQLMSIDPHFFSTMFGVYIFAGAYQTFFSVLAITMIILRRAGYLKNIVNENHLHDIAKWMFTFTVFWAYTGFSQYMLIWYANLPEETEFFLLRFNEHWEFFTLALFCAKFFLPFFLLLPRGNKRCEEIVFGTAVWILVTEYLDLNWLIQPQFWPNGPQIAFADVGVWIGFLGVFGLLVTRFFQKNNLVSIRDPYLPDSVYHHHVQ